LAQLWQRIKKIGPALVLAAVVLGPGSITLSTIAGSLYQYELLWVLLLATIFMVTYTLMAARIGLVTRQTLFAVARRKYGVGLSRIGGLFGFLSILAFQAGNMAAVGFVGNALTGSDPRIWSSLFFLPAMGLFLLPNLYGKLELLVKVVIGLMIVGFVGTLFIVGVDWRNAAAGLWPGFPNSEAIFLALGMAATTFSIAAAAYQNHLMREKNWGVENLATEGLDTLLGIGILGSVSVVVLLTSAGVIHGSGERVFTAQTMAMQLEPLFGPAAFYLFISGFFFASLSSLVVNPFIGATLLVDGFGHDTSIDGRALKSWAVAVLAAGLTVVLLFKGSPIELLRVAQALAVIAFPVLGFLIWSIARDRKIMGDHANSRLIDLLAGLGYLTIIGIVLNYVRQILGLI
jgi:Mn2+/Fe2+ NRAMP family transporter